MIAQIMNLGLSPIIYHTEPMRYINGCSDFQHRATSDCEVLSAHRRSSLTTALGEIEGDATAGTP